MSPNGSSRDEGSATVPAPWMGAAVRGRRPYGRRVASRAITGRNRSRTDPTVGRFTRSQINRIVNAGFEGFARQVSGLRSEPTLGSRQNVLLASPGQALPMLAA
jgi:hypothetical protein